MSKTTIFTTIGPVTVDGTVTVDEGTGILKVHGTGYQCTARFQCGSWFGYTYDAGPATPLPTLIDAPGPAPVTPAADPDIPF